MVTKKNESSFNTIFRALFFDIRYFEYGYIYVIEDFHDFLVSESKLL